MTFEEDFPSLKDKNVVRCVDGTWFYRSENINPKDESGMYSGLIVNKYCLDKQKVREAIKKLIKLKNIPFTELKDGKVITNLLGSSTTELIRTSQADVLIELHKELGL